MCPGRVGVLSWCVGSAPRCIREASQRGTDTPSDASMRQPPNASQTRGDLR